MSRKATVIFAAAPLYEKEWWQYVLIPPRRAYKLRAAEKITAIIGLNAP
jgi:hypothetical protein